MANNMMLMSEWLDPRKYKKNLGSSSKGKEKAEGGKKK